MRLYVVQAFRPASEADLKVRITYKMKNALAEVGGE